MMIQFIKDHRRPGCPSYNPPCPTGFTMGLGTFTCLSCLSQLGQVLQKIQSENPSLVQLLDPNKPGSLIFGEPRMKVPYMQPLPTSCLGKKERTAQHWSGVRTLHISFSILTLINQTVSNQHEICMVLSTQCMCNLDPLKTNCMNREGS